MGKLDFRDPNVQIAGLVCFLAAAIMYVFFLTSLVPFGYKARSEQIAKLSGEYEKISADLMKAKQSASRLPQVQAEFDQIKKRWEESSTLLPTEKEMAELLTQITVSGQRAGVDFLLFEPKPPTPRDIYVEHPVELEVQGGYHDIGMFLSRVSNLPRIVNVNSIQMKNVPNPADPKGPQIVDANLSVSAYRLLTEGERAQGAPATPAGPSGRPAGARPQVASAAQAGGGNGRAH
ncbi:MAG: type 4a pilus biogenesis protein PilO [bacterium]